MICGEIRRYLRDDSLIRVSRSVRDTAYRLAELGEREKRILALRCYDGKTQIEVVNAIGISQAQVSCLEKGALSRLKKAIVS